jgi:PIN domain nuclease of toxin-antitoxin system
LEDADRAYPLREAAFTKEVALVAHEIVLRTRDPVDHFLAATALVYDLTLMTVDNDLIGLEWLPTRSD